MFFNVNLHNETVFEKLLFPCLRFRKEVFDSSYSSDLCPSLHVTEDYVNSVRNSISDGMTDDFAKPVNWILSSTREDTLIILSQYDADKLLPAIRKFSVASLSIYAPRLTKSIPSFGRLDLFGVGADLNPERPSSAMTRVLELFAGSLYCSSFEEYCNLRLFLGLMKDMHKDVPEEGISSDGLMPESTRALLKWPIRCPFGDNPLPLLRP